MKLLVAALLLTQASIEFFPELLRVPLVSLKFTAHKKNPVCVRIGTGSLPQTPGKGTTQV